MAKKKKTIEKKFEELGIDFKSENESAKKIIEDRTSNSIPPEEIFDSIKHWHEIAGINVSTENTLEELIAQWDIVNSEIEETFKAWNDFVYHYNRRNRGLSDNAKVNEYKTELLDGLGDTIWTCVGMILRLGINPDDVMQRILDSNNSKFIKMNNGYSTTNIVLETEDKYKKQGIEVEHHVDNGYLVFRNKETKKILKPVTFVEPKLEELL